MTIYQTNLWVCEVCGRCESTCEETDPYADPVVRPPRPEWDYVEEAGNERLACPECVKAHTVKAG